MRGYRVCPRSRYDVYVVAVGNVDDDKDSGDAFPDANKQAAVTKLDARRRKTRLPSGRLRTPASRTSPNTFNLTLNLDEIGVAYYTVDAYDQDESRRRGRQERRRRLRRGGVRQGGGQRQRHLQHQD